MGGFKYIHAILLIVTINLVFLSFVECQWDFKANNAQWDSGYNAEIAKLRSRRDIPGDGDPNWPDRECPPEDPLNTCNEPPYYPFDPIRIYLENLGFVQGRSLVFMPYRYINIFLGIPYARAPYREKRFKPPEDPGPGWDFGHTTWYASKMGDACPQELWHFGDKFDEPRNMSDNCLTLNVYMPNFTDVSEARRKYPVMVYVHGEDFKSGDAMLQPGHILAKKEVVVVTFNYRLGALGFMSTMDSHAPGNYGLWDILKVLEWIQKHIPLFYGDPDRVTVVGHGSGAAAVSLLMLSPKSRYQGYKNLFHQAILMGGSDLCEWAYVDNVDVGLGPWYQSNPWEYAKDLGREVGCDPDVPRELFINCLEDRHHDEIVNASASVYKKYGMLSGPFGPVIDGVILPKSPKELRDEGSYMKIPILTGVNRDDGAYLVENITKNIIGVRIHEGLDPKTFRDIIHNMVKNRIMIKNVEETTNAVEFEYTFWAKPDNKTAVRQNLIDLYSDMYWGWCTDALIKYHLPSDHPVYMYEFNFRSEFEVLPAWMGVPYGRDVNYLFGAPFFNETLANITGVYPDQLEWTFLDKNISVFVQDMWCNFTKYGNPTVEYIRNVTWYPMTQFNLSYLHIGEWSYMDINYRQNHYAFWREYFPLVSDRFAITTTPFPTPRPLLEYQVATWSIVGASIITIFIIVALGITLWRRTRS